jgi:ABC-2 type transport system permease protein
MYRVLVKTVRDKKAFIVGWGLGLLFLGYLMTIFYPAFHQDDGLDQLVSKLPKAFQGLVGSLDNLKQLPTYIGSQLFEVRIPIMVSILSIILAIGLSIGEEEKGQLRTLMAMPISRTRILLGKWLAIGVIAGVCTTAIMAGIGIGLVSISETLDVQVLLRLSLVTWLLIVTLATIVLCLGLGTGKRGLTMGVGVLVAAGSFILTTFSSAVEWLQPYEKLSLLHYFNAVDVAKGTIAIGDVMVFVATAVLLISYGIVAFRRRDVR